jgi:V/A-type H+-transporting ATPase subunit F
MARLVVLAESEIALGFQLAGVEVVRAGDFESAREQLLRLIEDSSVGLIAVSDAFIEQLDNATRQRIEMSYKPVVVPLPAGGPVMGFAMRREYLAALIQRAIGFHITFEDKAQTPP